MSKLFESLLADSSCRQRANDKYTRFQFKITETTFYFFLSEMCLFTMSLVQTLRLYEKPCAEKGIQTHVLLDLMYIC